MKENKCLYYKKCKFQWGFLDFIRLHKKFKLTQSEDLRIIKHETLEKNKITSNEEFEKIKMSTFLVC